MPPSNKVRHTVRQDPRATVRRAVDPQDVGWTQRPWDLPVESTSFHREPLPIGHWPLASRIKSSSCFAASDEMKRSFSFCKYLVRFQGALTSDEIGQDHRCISS